MLAFNADFSYNKVRFLQTFIMEQKMAKVCDICGKHSSVGHSISHAHNLTLRRWQPNLRHVRALVDGQVKRIQVCAKCLKAGKVLKAPHKTRIKPSSAPVAMETPAVTAAANVFEAVEPATELTSAV